MQHPVNYMCDICDYVTDTVREIFCGESRDYSSYEVISILNEIARFIIGKENELIEDWGGYHDKK